MYNTQFWEERGCDEFGWEKNFCHYNDGRDFNLKYIGTMHIKKNKRQNIKEQLQANSANCFKLFQKSLQIILQQKKNKSKTNKRVYIVHSITTRKKDGKLCFSFDHFFQKHSFNSVESCQLSYSFVDLYFLILFFFRFKSQNTCIKN